MEERTIRSWKDLDEPETVLNPAGVIDLTNLTGGMQINSEWVATIGCCPSWSGQNC